jgi:hypothetical protein
MKWIAMLVRFRMNSINIHVGAINHIKLMTKNHSV